MGMMTATTPSVASTAKNQIQRRLRPGGVTGERDGAVEWCTDTVLPSLGKALGQFRLGDHDDALFGHQEAAAAVVLQVVTDGGILRDLHVLVDDRLANVAMPADVHAIEE